MPGFERKNTQYLLKSQASNNEILKYELKIKKDLLKLKLQSSTDLTPREKPGMYTVSSEFRNELIKMRESNFMQKVQNDKRMLGDG